MTEAQTDEVKVEPHRRAVADYERSELDCPEGVYLVQLIGHYGEGISSGGAHFINTRWATVKEAQYDKDNDWRFTGETKDVARSARFFIKFYLTKGEAKGGGDNPYGIRQAESFLHANDFNTEGEFNPATGQYEFSIDEAFSQCLDKTAWVRVYHKKDGDFGWQIDTSDFSKNPPYRNAPRNNEQTS